MELDEQPALYFWEDYMALSYYQELIREQCKQGKKIPFIPMACPDTGSFIGWKKCYVNVDTELLEKDCFGGLILKPHEHYNERVIVKLLIPEDAKRSSGFSRRCRCDKAVVLEIQTVDGDPLNDNIVAYSGYDPSFMYVKGETVIPKAPFCEDRFEECASGIHFYINRQEAVNNIS